MIARLTLRRLATCCLLLGCGCTAGKNSRGVHDPDPSVKIPAIKAAAAGHDESAVAQLVGDLDSDDPAVRLFAIQGLSRLTGRSFGYCYYAGDSDRAAAEARWKDWLAHRHDAAPATVPATNSSSAVAPPATPEAP